MRTIVIVLSACLISAGSFAADQTSTGANSKLAVMLAAKDANGKPIISPEEQAYFTASTIISALSSMTSCKKR